MTTFPLGGLITLCVLLPNLLVFIAPPKNRLPENDLINEKKIKILTVVERIGQTGSFFLPFFYPIHINTPLQTAAFVVMALALLMYYAGWIRYLVLGRDESLLYRSMFMIPIPMAVFPVIYFLMASYILASFWLFFAALLLGVGHISISWINAQKVITEAEPINYKNKA
ncbi:MAG: hypothetical protein JEZ06_05815 [Anaerolineaceae bacterium]|nr:hypothetical protein [Anaerolineaceae bacterium]